MRAQYGCNFLDTQIGQRIVRTSQSDHISFRYIREWILSKYHQHNRDKVCNDMAVC